MTMEPDRITIPTSYLNHSSVLALDIGASVIKIAYRPNQTDAEGKPQPLPAQQTVCLSTLPMTEAPHTLPAFLNNNLSLPPAGSSGPKLRVAATGIGTSRIKAELEKHFHIRLEPLVRCDCLAGALVHLQRLVPAPALFWPVDAALLQAAVSDALGVTRRRLRSLASADVKRMDSSEIPTPDVQEILMQLDAFDTPPEVLACMLQLGTSLPAHKEELFPCLLAVVGSGATFLKVTKTGVFSMCDVSCRAGAMFLGLGRILTGATTFSSLLCLASEGVASNVHTVVSDLPGMATGELHNKSAADADVALDSILYSFGKAQDMDPAKFASCDLAAALLCTTVRDLVQTAKNLAEAVSCRRVVFCGSFVQPVAVREAVTRRFIITNALAQQDRKMPFCILKPSAHLGALGALMGVDDRDCQ